jgi:hypothetical protein
MRLQSRQLMGRWPDGARRLARGQVVCRQTGFAGLAPHDLRRSCAKLCHSAGGELEQIQSCSDMFLCKLPSVISAASSEFVALSTIASVSNHDSGLPQRTCRRLSGQVDFERFSAGHVRASEYRVSGLPATRIADFPAFMS